MKEVTAREVTEVNSGFTGKLPVTRKARRRELKEGLNLKVTSFTYY